MINARTAWLAGSLAGATLALFSLFLPDGGLPSDDLAVARVNGHAISGHELDLALAAMERDSRNPLPEDARERALGRLIDEELLFQRAIELDLPRNASTIRHSIVIAMIDSVIAQADADPAEVELRELFNAEQARFAAEPRLRLDWRSGGLTGDLTRPAGHPPDRLLSVSNLRPYLGEALVRAAAEIEADGETVIVTLGERRHQVTLLEREPGERADFESRRDAVTALWIERAQEAALEADLDRLRAGADIEREQP